MNYWDAWGDLQLGRSIGEVIDIETHMRAGEYVLAGMAMVQLRFNLLNIHEKMRAQMGMKEVQE